MTKSAIGVLSMYEIEKSIGFLLAKGYQRAWAIFREEIEQFDLTPPQFALLAFLWVEDGLTQTQLSEKSQVDRTTIGGLIDRLVKNNLVLRKPHPQDRRAHLIHLTNKGKEMESPLSNCANRSLSRLTKGLSELEILELRRMLEIIRGERVVYEIPTC